jgi:NAD(P)-dependent dehydrogenase (short-subunit alcohol dehydrogenase family)
VTGSSSGIGAAIARELSVRGARVAVTSRSRERAQRVVDELGGAGGSAAAYAADLSVPAQAAELVEAVVADHGSLDILVNNAGIGMVRPSVAITVEEWTTALMVDLTAPFLCAQAAGRRMLAAGRGVIINIGSVFGRLGMPERAAYCAAKHGLQGVTKALAAEWAPHGVRVLQVDPAFVRTGFILESMERGGFGAAEIERRTPQGRMAEPAEVAKVVAFLASDEAEYITGSSVAVDGGWTSYGGW